VRECRLNRSFKDIWRSVGVPLTGSGNPQEIQWSNPLEGTAKAPWPDRAMHSMVVFNDSLYIFAGIGLRVGSSEVGDQVLKDVWRSPDGIAWTEIATSPAWSTVREASGIGRYGQAATAARGKIYMFGGAEKTGQNTYYLNDVWRTSDGVIWEEVIRHAEWPGRFLSQSLVYQDSIWVIGGQRCGKATSNTTLEYQRTAECTRAGSGDEPFHYGDVWVSTGNGTQWSVATESAEWAGKSAHGLLMWDNNNYEPPAALERKALWILGGQSGFQKAFNSTLLSYEF